MTVLSQPPTPPLRIAVIGSGISGLSAAWLLSRGGHAVTLYEKEDRPGGHTNTVDVDGAGPVDTGFIVYNEASYPNLVALFDTLGVPTRETDMSFAVSVDGGRLEYAGTGLSGLFAQRSNLFKPRFLGMVADVLRFYRAAPALLDRSDAETLTLGAFLDEGGYSEAFVRDHLLPMAAAIWSTPAEAMRDHPAAAFVRFCANHGLLQVRDRPVWRTVEGGSRAYVRRLLDTMPGVLRLNAAIARVRREPCGIVVEHRDGEQTGFDHVVMACHADQALALLADPDPEERRLLAAFPYQRNVAILHTDASLMPVRRKVWASWNYLSRHDADSDAVCVSYWMNRLQGFLPAERDLFVTLNPIHTPRAGTILRSFLYDHPVFDLGALRAQKDLWRLQGRWGTWFCGAYFGAGFHEDGLQAGLAVAEALGGVRRPWKVANESGRIFPGPVRAALLAERVS